MTLHVEDREAPFVIGTTGGRILLAEERPGRPRRHLGRIVLLGCVVVLVLGTWIGAREVRSLLTPSQCRATAGGRTVRLAPDQMDNAATITAIAVRRGLPARAATIALATAMQESKIRNVEYGDRDSLGLFQQRPSQGWGTPQQILDPEHATMRFYDALVKVPGWQTMEITKVAQEVQRSAAPEAYAQHEPEARVLASALAGHSPAALGCRLRSEPTTGDVAGLERAMFTEYGLRPVPGARPGTLVVTIPDETLAWSVAHWGVAKAAATGVTRVEVAGRTWRRTADDSAFAWPSGGTGGARTVVLTLA